jgi:ribosomal protein L37AE/L43A
MTDFPRSLVEFQSRFPDEAACVAYLFAARWPHGFVCPACGKNKAWQLQTKAWTWECAGCGKQTSVTAGTGNISVVKSAIVPNSEKRAVRRGFLIYLRTKTGAAAGA